MKAPAPVLAPPYSGATSQAIVRASAAITALDTALFRHPCAAPWMLRASWSGYAQGLKLGGAEIDEIDVISWATSVHIAGRRPPSTIHVNYAGYRPWVERLSVNTSGHWNVALPFTAVPPDFSDWPPLCAAVEILHQWAKADPSTEPWLGLPELLYGMRLSARPLPCLVVGDRGLRQRGQVQPTEAASKILHGVASAAEAGLTRLRWLEDDRARAIAAITNEHRPGMLPDLMALMMAAPVMSPEALVRLIPAATGGRTISLSGAGKLLNRAAGLGLVREVSGRSRGWRIYVLPDVAVSLGFAAKRGRPAKSGKRPALLVDDQPTTSAMAALDAEMNAIADRWPDLARIGGGEEMLGGGPLSWKNE
jgi:hypothetical protein